LGLVGFGQPDDGIIQMACVVKDIHAAMRAWVGKLRVGPWFLLDRFTGEEPLYRGARGYGFHHWGCATCQFDRDVEQYRQAGHEVGFICRVPSGRPGALLYLNAAAAATGAGGPALPSA
jgi:hypothetical protein